MPNPNLGNIIGQTYAETFLDTQTTAKATAKRNRKLLDFNDSIYRVLDNTVGKVAAHEPAAWWDWWHNYNVMSIGKKPVYVDNYYNPVDVPYVPYMPADIPDIPVSIPLDSTATVSALRCSSASVPRLLCPRDEGLDLERPDADRERSNRRPRPVAKPADRASSTFKPVIDITLGHQPFIAVTTTDKETIVADRRACFLGLGGRLAAGERAQSGRPAAHGLRLVGDPKHQAGRGR